MKIYFDVRFKPFIPFAVKTKSKTTEKNEKEKEKRKKHKNKYKPNGVSTYIQMQMKIVSMAIPFNSLMLFSASSTVICLSSHRL